MVQNTNYKNKYLKYKLKYLKMINQQKNQKGGMEGNIEDLLDGLDLEGVDMQELQSEFTRRDQEILDYFKQKLRTDENINDIKKLLNNDPTLRSLNLYGELFKYTNSDHIGPAGAKYLAEMLQHNATLQDLELSYNEIGDAGAKHLAEMLQHNTTLQHLALGKNEIGDAGAQHLAEALKHNATLQRLIFYNNKIGAAGAKDLAEALKHNDTLQFLNLRNNKIGDAGVKDLSEALKHNDTLQFLELGTNNISDAGAKDLAEALKQNTTLKYLNLGDNKIGDAGARALVEVIDKNTTLNDLDLKRNIITDDSVDIIALMIKNNTNLQSLSLKGNNLSDVTVSEPIRATIAEAFRHNTTLNNISWNGWLFSQEQQNKFYPEEAENRARDADIRDIIPIIQHCRTTGENFYEYLRTNNLRYLMRFGNMDEASYQNLRETYPELPYVSPWKYFNIIEPELAVGMAMYQKILNEHPNDLDAVMAHPKFPYKLFEILNMPGLRDIIITKLIDPLPDVWTAEDIKLAIIDAYPEFASAAQNPDHGDICYSVNQSYQSDIVKRWLLCREHKKCKWDGEDSKCKKK